MILWIVCVLYNKKINEIASYKNFIDVVDKHSDVSLIILDNADNGDVRNQNKLVSSKHYIYISNDGNIGLSKAYNRALQHIDSTMEDDSWVMLADDDTIFSAEYLENLHTAIKKIEQKESSRNTLPQIVTGIVKSEYGVMSPYKVEGARTIDINCKPNHVYSCLHGINSGLCVKRSLLKSIGDYDDRLFLDYIDYLFFYKINRTQNNKVLIVDGEIRQKFSAADTSNVTGMKNRFNLFSKDFSIYCRITHQPISYRIYILIKRWLNIEKFAILKSLSK